MKLISIILIFFSLIIFSCKKETFISSRDARLTLSADTLRFDTLFTSTGSVTLFFKIKNDNNQKLQLSHVSLKGGVASPFKINVDGNPGPEVKEIEVGANDSIYVFVSVSLDTNASSAPFLIQDSIEIGYNGNQRFVQLESWGQNAHFLRSVRIVGNVTWTNDLPYVIIGGLQVDTNALLSIEKGCRIYLHADAPFIVDGSLQVHGEQYDSAKVYFRSDRLDNPYSRFPAGWPGIYFRGESRDNVLDFAVIENAYQGIVAEKPSPNAFPKIILNQCIIDNVYDAGILAVQSSIAASNCVISNCGKNIQLVYGGDYRFTHCTVASFSGNYLSHTEPVLLVTDFVKQGNTVHTSDLDARFVNCIFWGAGGTVEDEVATSRQGMGRFAVDFNNCLWKVKTSPANTAVSNIINDEDPVFDSINIEKGYFDFRLKESSPAINKGINTALLLDLDGNPRTAGMPDLGAYERQ